MLLTYLDIKLRNSLVTCVSDIQFSVNSVNFIVIYRTIAKILEIYYWDILIWATLQP